MSGRDLRRPGIQSGFSLLEVLVALAIMMAGLLAVLAVFPYTMSGQRDAELLTIAAALSQWKAEEIRRDDSRAGELVAEIRRRTTPTEPIVFIQEPRLTYSFNGQTLKYRHLPASDPRATPGVARVIVRYAPGYRPGQDVLYELRFN